MTPRALILTLTLWSAWSTVPELMETTAEAATVTYQISGTPGFTGAQPVSATAQFTTSTNQIVVVITNNEENPNTDAQTINAIIFNISTTPTSSLTASSTTGSAQDTRTFTKGNTTPTIGSGATTQWATSNSGATLTIGSMSPGTLTRNPHDHTLIGLGLNGGNTYPNANPSIDSSSHSPFLGFTATFTIVVPGVTSATTVTSATFEMGTIAGQDATGVIFVSSPEPPTLALGGIGLASLAAFRALRRGKARV